MYRPSNYIYFFASRKVFLNLREAAVNYVAVTSAQHHKAVLSSLTQKLKTNRLQEYHLLSTTNALLSSQNVPKIVVGRGSAPDPTGKLTTLTQSASPSPDPTPLAPRFSRLRHSIAMSPASQFQDPGSSAVTLTLSPVRYFDGPPLND